MKYRLREQVFFSEWASFLFNISPRRLRTRQGQLLVICGILPLVTEPDQFRTVSSR